MEVLHEDPAGEPLDAPLQPHLVFCFFIFFTNSPASPRSSQSTHRRCSLVLSSARNMLLLANCVLLIFFLTNIQLSYFFALVAALEALFTLRASSFLFLKQYSTNYHWIGFLEILLVFCCLIHLANCKFDQFQRSYSE